MQIQLWMRKTRDSNVTSLLMVSDIFLTHYTKLQPRGKGVGWRFSRMHTTSHHFITHVREGPGGTTNCPWTKYTKVSTATSSFTSWLRGHEMNGRPNFKFERDSVVQKQVCLISKNSIILSQYTAIKNPRDAYISIKSILVKIQTVYFWWRNVQILYNKVLTLSILLCQNESNDSGIGSVWENLECICRLHGSQLAARLNIRLKFIKPC